MEGFILTEDVRKFAEMLKAHAATMLTAISTLEDGSIRATDDRHIEDMVDAVKCSVDATYEVVMKGIKS